MTVAEKKIEKLEKEIVDLKKEHEIELRIEHIIAIANEKKHKKEEEDKALYTEWENLLDKLYSLEDRLVAIMRISKALKENEIELPKEWWHYDNSDTNGIKFVGIVSEIIVLKKDGTYCEVSLDGFNEEYYCNIATEYYYDIKCKNIDESIAILKRSIMVMKLFLTDFDRFEKEFYDYVDNL